MIGTTVANYRIDEKLGEGGMGVVYKAMDLSLDRVVAIKVISADLSRDPGLMERFRAEAKAQANLNHTNIASLYSLLSVDNYNAIVMEFLEGETLDQMLRRRGLIPSEEAVPLFRQALLGIGFAHRSGIIHRDIKPGNIMVNKYGVVKVMDFGIAKVLGGQRLTRTGTQVGTAAYMSPEQIRNQRSDIRSDIYSLGVTLYELLTAHLPFESDSEFEMMSDHVNTPPPPPVRHYPYIPRGIEQCVLKALEKNPDARFQTVEEFGSALEYPQGIEQWLAARPALQSPAILHTGATPAPSANALATSVGGSTFPSTGTHYPAAVPVYATPAPISQGPVQPAISNAAPPTGTSFWSHKKNLPLIAAGAALVLAGLAFGGYQLFKPKPVAATLSSSSGTGGGSGVLLPGPAFRDLASHDSGSKEKNASTLLSATGSPSDLPTAPKDTVPTPPAPVLSDSEASTQALENAQKALNSGRLFRPRGNSAFYWAKQAEGDGNPDAARVQQEVLETATRQVQKLKDAKNFTAAANLSSELVESYPKRSDLLQLQTSIQNDERSYEKQQEQQRQAEAERQRQLSAQQQAEAQRQQQLWAQQQAQAEADRQRQLQIQNQNAEQLRLQAQQQRTQRPLAAAGTFVVTHRHLGFNGLNQRLERSFCAGTLTIGTNGTIRYDCVQTRDQRCEHATFNASDIKEAKMARDGGLHIATRTMGNWDFSGQPQQINGAFQAVNQMMANQR